MTTDGWTSNQCFNYMSLTIHYITKAFQLVSNTLGIKIVTESETGEAIKEKIQNLFKDWGISKKVECVTTDNGKLNIILNCKN